MSAKLQVTYIVYQFSCLQEFLFSDRFDVGQNVISVVNEYSMKPNFTYMIYVWYNQVENFNRLKVDNLRGQVSVYFL